ncbi:MAG: DUF748 domain-containing protein [Planctomycetes bacterium]|nr:DUF748 domain-containing protein [Planctomycetota bacterium]
MTEPSATPKPRRRLVRWLKRGVMVAFVLAVVVRVTLPLWLPEALAAALRESGIHVAYEDFDLSLLGGDVEFRHVDVSLADRGELAHVEYACVDVDVSGFLFLEARVHRVELDGLDISLHRRADGSWDLPRPADVTNGDEVAEVSGGSETVEPWSLASPIQLDALRVQHARVNVRDELAGRDSVVELNLRVSDIGHPSRPALVSIQVTSPDLADAVIFEGTADSSEQRAELELEFGMRGQFGGAIAAACAEIGLWRAEQSLTAGASLRVAIDSARDRRRLDASLVVDAVHLEVDRREAVERGSVAVQATVEPERTSVSVTDCSADVDMASLVEPLRAHGIVGVVDKAALAASAGLEVRRVNDGIEMRGAVRDVALRSTEPWFELASAEFDVAIESARTTVRRVVVDGLDVPLRRGDGGDVAVLGVRSIATAAEETVGTAEAIVQPSPKSGDALCFAIDEFAIQNSRVRWLDPRIEGGEVAVGISASLLGLTWGGDAPGHAALTLAFESPNIGRIEFDGGLTSRPGPLDADAAVSVRADRLDLSSLAPVLGEDLAGWQDAAFSLAAAAGLRGVDDSFEVDARIRDVELSRGGAPVARVGGIRIGKSRFGRDLSIGEVAVGSAQWFGGEGRKLEIDATASGFAMGVPTEIGLQLACGGDRAVLDGVATVDGARVDAKLHARSDLSSTGAVASFLPPDRYLAFESAVFDASFELRADRNESGGRSVSLTARDLSLVPDAAKTPSLAVREVVVDVPRIDDELIHVREFAISGIEVESVLSDSGAEFASLGRRTGATESPSPVAVAPVPVEPAAEPSTRWPHVDVERVSVELARFALREGDGPTLAFQGSLRNDAPIVVLAEDPESIDPWNFELLLSEQAALDRLRLGLELAPWQLQPRAAVEFEADGLRGAAIQAAIPSAVAGLDLSGIDGGSLRAALEARLEVRRRSPIDLDLGRGFGVEGQLRGFEYRAVADGEVLAGVDSVFVDAPRLGGRGGQHVREITIDGVRGRIERDAEGLRVLGILIPAGQPAAPEVEQAPETVQVVEASTGGDTPTAPPAKPLRVDRFELQGVSFEFEDRSCDPVVRLPIVDASVSVTGFRKGEEKPPPTRLSVSVRCGKVELPQRTKASSALVGLLSSAGAALIGSGDKTKTEQRTALEELVVEGSIVPSQPPRGELVAEVVGFELLTVRGLAKQSGVEIGDGVLDTRVEVEFQESGHTETRTSIRFQDLVIDEPPGGPISTYLKLPAPLQSVVFVLKDEDDRISIPLDVTVDSTGGVSAGAIAGEAVTALGRVIADAIAASPFRVAGMATGLFSFGKEAPAAPASAVVEFAPGAARVPADALVSLRDLVDIALDDDELRIVLQPVLGQADLDRARTLAMPGAPDRAELVDALRQRKRGLWRDRERVASRAESLRTLGRDFETEREQLRRLDAELSDCETALDEASALLRPGAERRVERRGRRFALDLAAARADALRERLVEQFGDDLVGRIETRRPRLPEAGLTRGAIAVTLRRTAK